MQTGGGGAAGEIFKFEAPIECPGWTAVSRGIAVDLGINNVGPIASSTVQAVQKHGISLDPLLARTPLQLEIADLLRPVEKVRRSSDANWLTNLGRSKMRARSLVNSGRQSI